jgi:hypothetical protein
MAPVDAARVPVGATSTKYIPGKEDPKWNASWEPLFKFGAPRDIVTAFDIKEKIFVKVFNNLIECVVLEGANQYDLAMLAWLLLHTEGHLFVNVPTQMEPKRLLHITNVKADSKVMDTTSKMTSSITKYPCHFVLQAKFQTYNSIFNSPVIHRHGLARIYKEVRNKVLEAQAG